MNWSIGINAQVHDPVKESISNYNNSSPLKDAFKNVKDSVVHISTEYEIANSPDGTFGSTGNNSYAMRFGSGLIYDDSGIIITNYHVVSSAINIVVTLSNGNIYSALVVGVDPYGDVAILLLENSTDETFVPVTFSNSSNLEVGDPVLAVGSSPDGSDSTLTFGIVSKIGGLLPNSDLGYSIPNVIQTDADFSPGVAGGPLVDLNGKVVGMNTAIFASSENFSSIGFAIPSNDIIRTIPPLIKTGTFEHPWLGILGSKLSPTLAEMFGLPLNYKGLLIEDVVENGPADKAGLKGMLIEGNRFGEQQILDKDIIIEIDGKPVSRFDDIISYVETSKIVGDKVNMTVNRNGQIINFIATLEAIPDIPIQDKEAQESPIIQDAVVTIIPGSNFYEGNSFYVTGEVKNNGSIVLEYVQVSITLYDINNKVIGTTSTVTNPNTIQPFDSAPFKLSIYPQDVSDVNSISDWRITASYS